MKKVQDRLKETAILHINTAATWRGGEKQTFFLASSLHRMGYKSFVICQRDSELFRRLNEAGIPCRPISMKGEFDIPAALKIAGIAREINAGIMHMHTAHAHSLGLISSIFYKPKFKVVSRRVDFRTGKNFLSRIKYRYADLFITVSGAIKKILIEDGINENKIATVYSGVQLSVYRDVKADYLFREFSNIKDLKRRLRLVNVAALTPQKDQETLIRAVKILKERGMDFVLFIVGEGELGEKLIALSKGLGLEDNVVFTGYRRDALNFIKLSNIFVMSSRWEGLGTSIIDAMALKRPVIATITGGIPELIKNRKNGILVQRESPIELSRAVIGLASDRTLQRKIASEGGKRAGDFSIEETVKKTIEQYRRLLRGI